MPLQSSAVLGVLRAIGEDTRLRLVALLQHGELTVSDLTDICGQSQPRISRHLKLLAEAGVVDKHREGAWVFFSLVGSGPIRDLVDGVLATVDAHDPVIAADLDRLDVVRGRRTRVAQEYFAHIAENWDEVRSLHASDEIVEAAIVDAVSDRPFHTLLDVGTATGRMLQLLTDAAPEPLQRVVGLDSSHSMLAVARANLARAELRGVELRQGDIYSPPFDRGAFDLVIVHQVLHFLEDPARAATECAQLVAPGGRLLIVDFAPHNVEFLRVQHAHQRLGFPDETVADWLRRSGLDVTAVQTLDPPTTPADQPERLTVSLWLAERTTASAATDAHRGDLDARDRHPNDARTDEPRRRVSVEAVSPMTATEAH